jgi:hypothetical protein
MEEHIVLYHGADVDSALDILNNGLNTERLLAMQTGRPVQIFPDWYTALDPEVAWFFASLSPGDKGRGYTVIEMHLKISDLEELFARGLANRSIIRNVPFVAEQIWFDLAAFEFLNARAEFRPYRE